MIIFIFHRKFDQRVVESEQSDSEVHFVLSTEEGSIRKNLELLLCLFVLDRKNILYKSKPFHSHTGCRFNFEQTSQYRVKKPFFFIKVLKS